MTAEQHYERRKAILDRAAELGARRYQIASDANQADKWTRLAEIDRERARLELELQQLHYRLKNVAASS